MNNIQFELHDKQGSFFIEMDGEKIACMTFLLTDDKQIIVDHTLVSPEYEGMGYAKALMQELLGYVQKNELKLISLCSFVSQYIVIHPEYEHLLED